MDSEEIVNQIIDKVNIDDNGITRFLQATAYTDFDYYNFDGLITPAFFTEKLYFENDISREYRDNIVKSMNSLIGKNTIFILGYQGCGKTTFINALINFYFSINKFKKNNKLLIDCDKRGVSYDKKPLDIIFRITLEDFLIENSERAAYFCDFFNDNFLVLKEISSYDKLYQYCNYYRSFINQSCSLKDMDNFHEFDTYLEKNLDFRDLLFLIMLYSLSLSYHDEVTMDPTILFIDNLDFIDSYSELRRFVRAFDDFTIDMSKNFKHLKLYKNAAVPFQYTDKIKIFVAMRETTKANLPNQHFSDAFTSIYMHLDITEAYDKSGIVRRRISTLSDNKRRGLSAVKARQMELISSIVKDIHTKRVFIPLFNNNYRSAIKIITKAVIENLPVMEEYEAIMKLSELSFRYGARGMLCKFILDNFNIEQYGEESCFKKIGVLNLLDRKNNEVSYPRLILTFLSNFTETRCDSANNCISISSIINSFKDILDPVLIKKCIWNMFDLKDTMWTHLVSFSQLVKFDEEENLLDTDGLNNLDYDLSKLHYSYAGKIYLEYVSTHFEFFTVRVFKEKYKPLFCRENLQFDDNGSYKFLNIIDRVYYEVNRCCETLREFNIRVCSVAGYPNPYENKNHLKYLESPYVCMYRKNNEKDFKQFHEDRLINAHISYIDKFRAFVLNYSDLTEEEKIAVNKALVERIEKYVDLIASGVLVSEYTKENLYNYYKQKIREINKNWKDFTIEINRDLIQTV
jgi:energy-coupling factor transporter ATP-binding protein EcfA2